MYPSEAKVDHLLLAIIFMTVFIRRTSVEDNTASERIRILAATYGCKILQPYEHDANVYKDNTASERIRILRLIHMYPAKVKVDDFLLTITFYDCFH